MISTTGFIYAIVNTVTGRKYIGSTAKLSKRWNDHRFHLRHGSHRNRHLQSAWRKYGEAAFAFVQLEAVIEDGQLIPREQYHLDAHAPLVYNVGACALSPMLGQKQSPEIVEATRERHRGNKYCLGRTHSQETKALLSAHRKGTTLSVHHLARITEGWAKRRSRQVSCANGHEWKEETTKWQTKPDGSHLRRICLVCFRASQAKSRATQKLERATHPKPRPIISNEQRARMGRLWKENVPPWKGKPLSEAHRNKLKAAWILRRSRQDRTYIRTPEIRQAARERVLARRQQKVA